MYKFYGFIKNIVDIVVAFCTLIIFSPILIIISISILIFQGRPIFFIQERPGLKNRPFKIIKFCTMNTRRDCNGELLAGRKRITKIGNLLRNSSLDELPSLINIVKGEMSFIGPRPLLMEYLELYNSEQIKRHNVKPGFSGLAQIKGRNSLTWEEKFNYDIEYVKKRNFILDLKIFFLTFYIVCFKKNINANNKDTMPLFQGTKT